MDIEENIGGLAKAHGPWRCFAVVALALLVLKLAMVWLLRDLPILGDETTYWDWSRNYLAEYWRREDLWSPLQFVYMAIMHKLFGEGAMVAAKAGHVLVHTATGIFFVLLGQQLGGRRTGLWAGILYLVLPETVSYSYLLFSETWSAFWFWGAALVYLRYQDRENVLYPILAGFMFGMAAMFRAINLYFMPLLLAHLLLSSRLPVKRRLVHAAAICLALLAPVSVQTTKNYLLFGELIPLSTGGWVPFWTAHNNFEPPDHNFAGPYFDSLQQGFPEARPEAKIEPGNGPAPDGRLVLTVRPAAKQRAEARAALKFIAEHPWLTARRTVRKIGDLFHPSIYFFRNVFVAHPSTFPARWLARPGVFFAVSATVMLTILLGLAGLIFCPERKVRSFGVLLILVHLLVCAFFYGPTRFRMAFTPVLILFMAWAVTHRNEVWQGLKSWRAIPLAALSALLILDWVLAIHELVAAL